MACLCGIGFTMSLFIGGLAFGDGEMLDRAKTGILLASLISGLAGWLLLRTASPMVSGRARAPNYHVGLP